MNAIDMIMLGVVPAVDVEAGAPTLAILRSVAVETLNNWSVYPQYNLNNR